MQQWSIIDTRRYVEARFGRAQHDIAAPSLNSLPERLAYVRYHYQETKRLLDAFTEKHLSNKPLLVVIHGGDEKGREDFEALMIEAGAHATACVLSLHAIADILAYAIYYALGFNLDANPLGKRRLNAASVKELLAQRPLCEAITETLSAFCCDQNYKHVAALANKSKHQSIVRPLLNEDLTGLRTPRHEFRFSAFSYDKKSFPEVPVLPVLESVYELASRTMLKVGHMLNDLLVQSEVFVTPNQTAKPPHYSPPRG